MLAFELALHCRINYIQLRDIKLFENCELIWVHKYTLLSYVAILLSTLKGKH